MTQNLQKQIAEAYAQQLVIPEGSNQKPQFALCVIGLVGAGKTTTLKRLCEHIPMVRVSGDEIRYLLHQRGLSHDDSARVISIAHGLTGRLKKAGYNIAHDNDFSSPVAREALRANNSKYGVREVWIRVCPPEDWIIRKLRSYQGSPWLFPDADAAVANYFARKTLQSQNPEIDQLPFVYEFNPAEANFSEQIEEGARRIREALNKTL